MQDMEFTIENGKLYMLQTRNGKRTAQAALRVAADLVKEGLLTREEALLKVDPKQLDTLLHPQFDAAALKAASPLAAGLAASPGAAVGAVCFTADEAVAAAKDGPVLLVRTETSPEDIEGMNVAQGILTARGGMTSHAAVVARGMGRCCITGCNDLKINEREGSFTVGAITVRRGEMLSLDGSTGNVYLGALPMTDAVTSPEFDVIMGWADEIRTMKVRTNADTPRDAATAVRFGAEGIGLTRTEHMFFESDRIPVMREMIMAKDEAQRRRALGRLLPMQRSDFEGIFRAMGGRPVTIRLLDPPLHEFLPTDQADIMALATDMNMTYDELSNRIRTLHEINPMMGHRGCRLTVTYPEIGEMQTRAIIEAAIRVKKETGQNVTPEIMIPLVGDLKELKFVKDIITATADPIIKKSGVKLTYLVGTMIEVPRAALVAGKLAREAEFFSFGTNDLTQMTYGFSRDDAGKFLETYFEKNVFDSDPFARLDQEGVGELMKIAVARGRKTRPDIKLGICGEHGGDPASVDFCYNIGLDYVSCSPYRVPIARLAAAHAKINADARKKA